MTIISPLDFTGLWRNLPYATGVSYESVDDYHGSTALTLSAVVITPHTRNEAQSSYGRYIRWKTVFKVPKEVWAASVLAAGKSGIYPKSRDNLTLGGLVWTVCTDVDATRNQSLYRLEADRLQIRPELGQYVQILEPTYTIDDYGARTWTLSNTVQVFAAIQPMTSEITDMVSKRGFKEHFRIYLQGISIPIPYGSYVVDQEGAKYFVIAHQNKFQLDELEYLEAVIPPWESP